MKNHEKRKKSDVNIILIRVAIIAILVVYTLIANSR